MEEARLNILKSQLDKQTDVLDSIYEKISERKKDIAKNKAQLESSAYQLHNLYCAFEDLFKLVADFFENNIDAGLSYHQELLRRMSISIKGIRPNLISEETYKLLSELKGFRHFFRHAYTYELDYSKVKLVLAKAVKLKNIFKKDVKTFLKQISPKC